MRTKKAMGFSLGLRRILNVAATLVKHNLSWPIFLTSLLWFLLRTGTRPSRAVYPCQQVARMNILVLGLPIIAPLWVRLKKWGESPLKALGASLLALFLVAGALGFTRTKTTVVSWFWQFKGLPREARVRATTTSPGVVWVHDEDVTNWDYGDDYYGREEYVDQNVVDNMTDQGLMALTGTNDVVDAWRRLLPHYQSGQKIAIKINLNANWDVVCEDRCETDCGHHDLRINALPQPANALIRGLRQMGVAESDIWIYESSKPITERYRQRVTSLYPDVQFFDNGCQRSAGWGGSAVDFHPPAGIADPPTKELTNVLVDADYLINMPILKKHGGTGVTLSFKNHLGSIEHVYPLHDWVYGPASDHAGEHYSSIYNPLVDIYLHADIRDKTILIVGDGLYGDKCSNNEKPQRWDVFGSDSPNSLFFSTDPVAIDSVMYDFLKAEMCPGFWEAVPLDISDYAHDYLKLAQDAGLGVFEHGDPWQGEDGYARIEFVRCEDSVCPGAPTPTPATSTPTQTPTTDRHLSYLPLIWKTYTEHPAEQADTRSRRLAMSVSMGIGS